MLTCSLLIGILGLTEPPSYEIVDLASITPFPSAESIAYDINSEGSATGIYQELPGIGADTYAVRWRWWDYGEYMKLLPPYNDNYGYPVPGWAINDDGWVISLSYKLGFWWSPFNTPRNWNADAYDEFYALKLITDVNNHAQITGMYTFGEQFILEAYIGDLLSDDVEGSLVPIGKAEGTKWCYGRAINDLGTVVGTAPPEQPLGPFQQFGVAYVDGEWSILPEQGDRNEVHAVSNAGIAVGMTSDPVDESWPLDGDAARWTLGDESTLEVLGRLPGHVLATAWDVNEHGIVVGESFVEHWGDSRAFIVLDGEMIDLNELVDDAGGWVLKAAYGINDRGQIVGWGTRPGATGKQAFRLDLIDPCPADFNKDGSIDVLDFVAFQSAFSVEDPSADCDGDALFKILDFICFQQAFAAGCDG